MNDSLVHGVALMGTVVSFEIVGHGNNPQQRSERHAAVDRAIAWFRLVEQVCTRFDPASELRILCDTVGQPVVVSEMLFRAVEFASALAHDSDGAFDPTIGHAIVNRAGGLPSTHSVTYRDLELSAAEHTITLHSPLLLDLGAVAKGMAVDVAARELQPFRNFAINAGGDLYFGGRNPKGDQWTVGIRHPGDRSQVIETLRVTDTAVCTSGDYESKQLDGSHHILDPRTSSVNSAMASASVTVIAPSAMVADGLSTAAFVLGPVDGIALLERQQVRGIMLTPSLERFETRP